MANLETLELTINGSATSASEGIDKLIASLSSLSEAILKPYSDLVDFNKALKETANLTKSIKMPDLGKITAAKSAGKAAKAAKNDYDPLTNNNRIAVNKAGPNAKPDDVWKAEYDARHKQLADEAADRRAKNNEYRERIKAEANAAKEQAKIEQQAKLDAIKAERQAMDVRGQETQAIMDQSTKLDLLRLKQDALKMETISLSKEGKLSAKQIAERSMQYQKLGEDIKKLEDKIAQSKDSTKGMEEQMKISATSMKASIKGVTKSASGLLSTIGRIFKTMMIRTAIRALLKAAKEGLDNYYQYSKKMGGVFASSMDKATSKWNQIKNQIGAGLGTALSSLLPILNAVGKAVVFVLNAVTALFALIGGQTTYSQAIEGMDEYAESAKGASGAAKEWLASFDELNVMTKSSGGGGASAVADFGNMFQEVELPAWMIEWKPIIEAVLAGTLGAIILPKIWDWVNKIFGLFSGGVADKAIDFVTDLLGDGVDNKLPDFGKQAADMGIFGAGAAAAAAALPVVTTEIEKIVAALDGVSALESLVGLIGELLTKAFAAIPVPFKLDTKEYDEFKEKHEKWIKDIDEKKVDIVINQGDVKEITVNIAYDPTVISLLDLWTRSKGTKSISVNIDGYAENIKKIDDWVGKESTKAVKVTIDNNSNLMALVDEWVKKTATKYVKVAFSANNAIDLFEQWIADDDTKNIKITGLKDLEKAAEDMSTFATASAAAAIALPVCAEYVGNIVKVLTGAKLLKSLADLIGDLAKQGTKEVKVKVDYDPKTVLKMDTFNKWVDSVPTKKVLVNIQYTANTALKAETIDAWAATVPTKKVNVNIIYGLDTVLKIAAIDVWTSATPTKKINVDVVYGLSTILKIATIDAWVKVTPIKTVNVNVVYGLKTVLMIATIDTWVKSSPTKTVNVNVNYGAKTVLKIALIDSWVKTSPTKKVKVNVNYGAKTVLKIALIDSWVKTAPTKTVNVNVNYGVKTVLKIAAIDSWVKATPTKTVNVNINYGVKTVLQMAVIDAWVKSAPTKTVYVKIVYTTNTILTKAVTEAWVKDTPTKTINIAIKDTNHSKSDWNTWINARPTKYINIILLDNNNGINKVTDWINERSTKKIDIDTGKKYTTTEEVVTDLWGIPFWDFLNKYFGINIFPKADSEALDQVKKDITGAASNIPTTVSVPRTTQSMITNSIQDAASNIPISLTASVTANLTNGNSIEQSLKNSIKNGINNTKINMTVGTNKTQIATISVAKQGGLFNSADLFVANEDGTAELIGQFGNQTGVANQDEIVDGIRKGVADANSEQNALLREQNGLLRGILQKTGNEKFGASSALGRVVSQSLDMYRAVTG